MLLWNIMVKHRFASYHITSSSRGPNLWITTNWRFPRSWSYPVVMDDPDLVLKQPWWRLGIPHERNRQRVISTTTKALSWRVRKSAHARHQGEWIPSWAEKAGTTTWDFQKYRSWKSKLNMFVEDIIWWITLYIHGHTCLLTISIRWSWIARRMGVREPINQNWWFEWNQLNFGPESCHKRPFGFLFKRRIMVNATSTISSTRNNGFRLCHLQKTDPRSSNST